MFDVESFNVSLFHCFTVSLFQCFNVFNACTNSLARDRADLLLFFLFFLLLSTNFSPLSTELWLPRTNNTG